MEKLILFFGTQAKTARALGVSRATMSIWVKRGFLPVARAIQAENLTRGAVQAQELWGYRKWL